MRWDLFNAIIDDTGPYLFFVDFFNWGEPILNEQLPRMLQKLNDYYIEVRISSSLSAEISDEVIESLVGNLDWLTVSIDGFSQESYEKYRVNGNLELALSNMERIARLKKARGVRKPHIDWQYLVFSFNEHEIELARRYARKIEVQFRPSAPFVDVENHPDWLSTIDDYVIDRYRHLRKQPAQHPVETVSA